MQPPSSKRLKFAQLATNRVNRATSAIRVIGNLSITTNYEWDESDAKQIVRELRKAVKEVEDRFTNGGNRAGDNFSIEP